MRVGVYVDGFNLYFGGRFTCGRGVPGWRWLDLRGLSSDLVGRRRDWPGAVIDRVVYCTALIDGATNASGRRDQDQYINALQASASIDHLELGHYAYRVKNAPLATKGPGGKPVLSTSTWPVMIKNADGKDQPNSIFMVSYAHREEKDSDVNVASHLLVDVLGGDVDAAIVISNDSDLRYPIQVARCHVPVCTVNPSSGPLAGDLRGTAADGVGRHWWVQLGESDFTGHQLADPAGGHARPQGW